MIQLLLLIFGIYFIGGFLSMVIYKAFWAADNEDEDESIGVFLLWIFYFILGVICLFFASVNRAAGFIAKKIKEKL